MKLNNLFNGYNLTNYAVTDSEVRLRVGVGKIVGLERTGEFDGNDRTWYEFRGIKYSRPIERFDYPVYNDPVYWQGDYDGTKLAGLEPGLDNFFYKIDHKLLSDKL